MPGDEQKATEEEPEGALGCRGRSDISTGWRDQRDEGCFPGGSSEDPGEEHSFSSKE